MDNPRFIDEEDIPMVHHDEDYDDYKTTNTIRVDETSFIEPDATEATSTLQLRQKLKRDKLSALYRHLNVTGDIDLIDLGQFSFTKDKKRGSQFLSYNGHRWVSLTKQTGNFFAPKNLSDKLGGLNTIKKILGIDKTPPALERSFKTATKLKVELPTDLDMESIPLEELSSLVENIYVKMREASQNTDLGMQEFLGIDKALQSIQGEFLNNTSN